MTGGSSGGAWFIGWTSASPGYINSDNSYGYDTTGACPVNTTVAATSNASTFNFNPPGPLGTLNVTSTTGFPAAGQITVVTVYGVLVLNYTMAVAGPPAMFTGVSVVSGMGATTSPTTWTLSTGGLVVLGNLAGNSPAMASPGKCQPGAGYGPYLDASANALRMQL
jgi:hypothetical protein